MSGVGKKAGREASVSEGCVDAGLCSAWKAGSCRSCHSRPQLDRAFSQLHGSMRLPQVTHEDRLRALTVATSCSLA